MTHWMETRICKKTQEAPLHSRAMDDKDCSVSKEGISTLSNPAAIARRKRIEIRRFRKFSYAVDSVRKDSNTAQISLHLKRARSSANELYDSWEDMEDSGNPSPKLKKEEGDICVQTTGKETVEFTEQPGRSSATCPEGKTADVSSSDPACRTTAQRFHSDMVEAPEQLSTRENNELQDPKFHAKEDIQDRQAVFGDLSSHCDMEVDFSASPTIAPSFAQSKACTSWSLLNQGCPLSGKLLLCGQRREMKDRVAIVPYFVQLSGDPAGSRSCLEKASTHSLHFFAVYDGHGGSQASQFCMERLHLTLAEELVTLWCVAKYANEDIVPCDWKSVMALCFLRMGKELRGLRPNGHCDDEDSTAIGCGGRITPESLGTSAVVVVVSSCQIVVASCGNSRAVLSRGGKAIPLSLNHKPEREDETNRVEAAGGQCFFCDDHNVGGPFASSGAMGDLHLKRFMLSEPVVTCIQRSAEDECLILASNGLWDVVNDDATCEIARKRLASTKSMRDSGMQDFGDDPASLAAAALLVKVALGRGSKDNISVVVVDLKT